MMKILILSDLHLEFAHLDIDSSDIDVVILAGDIHTKLNGVKWALEQKINCPVMYVLGNHEFYSSSYPALFDKLKEFTQGTNIEILENSATDIGPIRFLGCTLWTDFELLGDPRIAGYECQQVMTDYKKIRKNPGFSKIRSLDTALIHRRSVYWLSQELERSQNKSCVVITHHAPSIKSIPERYREDLVSSAYASDLEELILRYKPKLWIHGHVHDSFDYLLGETRVICNPRGYLGEENPEFNPQQTVEL